MSIDKNQIGLAGEYYVLAQLSARGMIATLTLGNAKGVDILVTNQNIDKLFKVEVKTTANRPRVEKLFSSEPAYHWTMGKKHEELNEANLIYCFVHMTVPTELPSFFLVPSRDVADYVKWQHEYWLSTRVHQVNETSMRQFRIPLDDPKGYRDHWGIFG